MARGAALAAAIAFSLLAVSGAGGAGAQTPKRGGTVVFGWPQQEPACLNVFVARCHPPSGGGLGAVAQQVLEGPFVVGPDLTLRPGFISRAPFTKKPPFTITYHIRPEARWSDGVPITARDFVFTHRTFLKYEPQSLHGTQVRSVKPLDAKTVRVVLRSRVAGWQGQLFGPVLPSHALAGEDLATIWTDRIVNPKTGRPIGSGPFLVDRFQRGRQLTLVRNPRYWGPHAAYLARLVIRFQVDGGSLVELFRRGELDVAARFPPAFAADLRREASVRVLPVRGSSWDHFEIRVGAGGHPALRRTLVRRALAYGIDRAALVRQFYAEFDPKARPLDSVVFPTYSRYYRPNWARYRYRPALARRLLRQEGCRRGADAIYLCADQRLSFRFVTTTIPGGFRFQLVERVQAQLRRVGIEVLPTNTTSQALFQQIVPSGAFDGLLFAWASGGVGSKAIFGCGGDDNFTGYCQRLVTSDFDEAERILDPDQQARVLNRADARMAKHVPVIPIYQQPQWAAVRKTVRNFVPASWNPLNPLSDAENWWLAG